MSASNKDVVRRWLDHLGTDDFNQRHMVQVICHDTSGTLRLDSLAAERRLREQLEPRLVGTIDRSYSLLAEGNMVAAIGVASQRELEHTSHWVQLFRVDDGQVCETWVSGSAGDVDWGPPPEEPHGRSGSEDAHKRTVQRWWETMRGYRGGETSRDGVNSFVQMFRVANGRIVKLRLRLTDR